jgi:fumarate hydratase subunit alpha
MREISAEKVIETIEQLSIKACCLLEKDVYHALEDALSREQSDVGREILGDILENARIAEEEFIPICQDTGMAVVFVEIGQDVHITGGSLVDAVNEGIRRGYQKGYLRKSVVRDPLTRENTGDNTPAIVHFHIEEGDKLRITVAPKGFGSENMSSVKMLKPSDGIKGIKEFIISTVDQAGPNPCPPIVVGVGIGGTMEKAALMAKRALLRPLGERSGLEHIRRLEEELLADINSLGIGPAGLGGTITALAVNVDVYPTHIAGLPVAVNLSCHALRHATATL